jgi:hypothetical protein
MLHRTAIVATLVLLAIAATDGQVQTDATVLRVSRVVLYKTGIGYFEHLGTVTGNQPLAVQFTGDQLDDVLKSLTAVDLGDGRITGISYDSPTPAERRLQALRVPLSQSASTLQVLDALRGSRVEVRTASTVIAGRLLNVERRARPESDRTVDRDEATLLTDAGDIVTIELEAGTRVRIANADLRQDVNRYLDIAGSDGDRSPRRVTLSTMGGGQRQVLVSYVGEAAVWKTTYRLVFPTAGGAPMLQGWAIVDNVSAADWDDVELSLVAGAPQAFRQPLATPLFTVRPVVPVAAATGLVPMTHAAPLVRGAGGIAGVVRDVGGTVLPGTQVTALDPARGAIGSAVADAQGRYQIAALPPGPIELRADLPGFGSVQVRVTAPASGTLQRDFTLSPSGLQETVTVAAESPVMRSSVGGIAGGRAGGRPAAPPPPAAMPREDIEQRMLDQTIAAEAANLGELFEYRLKDRVTIKRNQSALVPILQTTVTAERISLWTEAMGLRPRRAVWLTNSSTLTLDAGSLAIVDGGAFGGEGLVDPIKPGERRLVSFAADIGVQVAARQTPNPVRVTRVRIAKGVVTQDIEHRQRRTYSVRNDDRDARVVVIEHPARADWKLVDVTPDETTATVHRFRVTAPPGQTTILEVNELRTEATTLSVGEFDHNRLTLIAQGGDARIALERALAPVFAKRAELDAIERDIQQRRQEVETIARDQERVRQNMAVLKGSPAERQLLERYTRQLDAQETRLDALKRELEGLTERQERTLRELAELIKAVQVDLPL